MVLVGTLALMMSSVTAFAEKSDSTAENNKVVSVAEYGAVPGDQIEDTMAINNAIWNVNAAGGGKVTIPSGTYIINPAVGINMQSNVELSMEPDTTLFVLGTDIRTYGVINIIDASNVYVHGGVISGERDRHRGTGGEWGMGVKILDSSNVCISDMKIRDNWGDGVYLSSSDDNGAKPGCDGVLIANCTIENNHRSNMSIVDADNITIDNCYLANANGAAPQCGINIESNADSNSQVPYGQVCANITIRNTTIDTMGMGDIMGQYFCFMTHYNPNLPSRHVADNIEIINCHFNGDCGNYSGTNVRFVDSSIRGTFYDTQNTSLSNTSYGSIWTDYAGNESDKWTNKPVGKTGLYNEGDEWLLYEAGVRNYGYTGLYFDETHGWWFIGNGKINMEFDDIFFDQNYGWWKIANGTVDSSYNDIFGSPTYGWWKITGGAVDFGYTGIFNSPEYGWWLINEGRVAFEYSDLYGDSNYGWWMIYGGEVAFNYTGLWGSDNYGWWLINNGSVAFDHDGWWEDPTFGTWYVRYGMVDFSVTE